MSPWDALALALLLVAGGLYLRGSRMRGAARGIGLWERVSFGAGWLALAAAVLPPLDRLALELFSAHMAQHELMMLIGAPLIMAARPLPIWLRALPLPRRQALRRHWRRVGLSRIWTIATQPPIAWLLHGTVVWVWHLPALYEGAMRFEAVHFVQHATFVGTSMLFWWGMIHGRYGRAGYGAAIVYVFTTAVHTGALGAVFAFAPSLVYGAYAGPGRARGVNPIVDQQAAGLIMWIPAGLLLTLFALGLLLAWLGVSRTRHEALRRHRATASTSAAGSTGFRSTHA